MPPKRKTRKRLQPKRAIAVTKPPTPKRSSLLLAVLPWAVSVLVLVVWIILAYRTYRTSSIVAVPEHTQQVDVVATGATETNGSSKTYTFDETAARLPSSVGILVVGDVMLGRYVETLMKKNGDDYPFTRVREKLLAGRDLVIGNLEGPIDETHAQTPDASLLFSFSPAVATILANQGFSIMSLANNHGLDQGVDGLRYTRETLRAANIDPLGHPQQINSDDVVIKTIADETVAILGFHATQSNFPIDDATQTVATLRTQYPDAFLIVYPHWGAEYQAFSNTRQQVLAHAFIDAGADAVLGHHPHVVEEAEVYKNRLIVYSLGNFIFDQYFSAETQKELAVALTLDSESVSYQFFPLISERSQPQLMDTAETKAWLEQYAERSNILDLADGKLELSRITANP